ncbi:MAG: ketoacyl-ACP synthase III [Kiritimatiellia bacterium]
MLETFNGLQLEAMACALPNRTVEVASFAERFGEEAVERFRSVVGIHAFHIADSDQTASDLAEAAARALITAGRLDPTTVDLLLFVTQTPDSIAPATSALLQRRLGLREDIFALDLNLGCTGFLAGLLTAAHFLQNAAVHRVLLLGGDTLTRQVDPMDKTVAMLFGDAGFAAVIGKEGDARWTIASATAGSDVITIPHHPPFFHMDGTAVFNFTVTRVPEQIEQVLTATGDSPKTIDLLLLHQANAFIVRQIARMTGFSEAQTPEALARYGNTSCASLPLLLCDLSQAGMKGLCHSLLSAFGVGLSWITCQMDVDFSRCLPIVLIPPHTHTLPQELQ